jgi:hypothetical protein
MGARRLFAAAIVGLGLLASAGSAQACSCAPLPAGKALRQADAAFVGRLLKVAPRSAGQADFRYLVQRVYKSGRGLSRGAVVSVRGPRGGAACGLPEGRGRSYGLLLRAGEAGAGVRWWSGRCGVLAPQDLRRVAKGRAARASSLASCAS